MKKFDKIKVAKEISRDMFLERKYGKAGAIINKKARTNEKIKLKNEIDYLLDEDFELEEDFDEQ